MAIVDVEKGEKREVNVYIVREDDKYQVSTAEGKLGVETVTSRREHGRSVLWYFHNGTADKVDVQLDFTPKPKEDCPIKSSQPEIQNCVVTLSGVPPTRLPHALPGRVHAVTEENVGFGDKERNYVLRVRKSDTNDWQQVDPRLVIDDWPTLFAKLFFLVTLLAGVALGHFVCRV